MSAEPPPWGCWPYRVALAGGWIDQPFVSALNPARVGSMVVVSIEPVAPYMERSGLATGTRRVAMQLWPEGVPALPPEQLVRTLYEVENRGRADPSGSQDMIGLVYPGINRLDYDVQVHRGVFPARVERLDDPEVEDWLERVLYLVPVAPRPAGYHPLGERRLDPEWILRLGRSGAACFEAIRRRDLEALGASLNECMRCWAALLPHTVRHPALTVDLETLLGFYQQRYPGAMYSGCGGGYLLVVSASPVPGGARIAIRRGRAA
ncbi:MAG: hypothetical protein N2652_06925 [Kiritimatiellae bacterium]|nr:hypothetical protein [Kiritimatiellia bacterium]